MQIAKCKLRIEFGLVVMLWLAMPLAAQDKPTEAIKIDKGGGVGYPALQHVPVLQRTRFGRDEAQHHRLVLGDKS